jgi:hypothetical protein
MNARRSGIRLAAALVVLAQLAVAGRSSAVSTTATNGLIGTLSTSRQFAAYANDQLLPSALCVYAEHVKREWLRRLEVADNWRDPILFVVRPREPAQTNTPAISMVVFQTDTHLKYQIHCVAPPRIDEEKLLAMIVEALCSEWANRGQATVWGEAYTVPLIPAWLVQGMATSIQGRYEVLRSITQHSVAAGRPQQAGDLLGAKTLPADPMERQLFQADAWIFTESLLALPDGARKLRNYLSILGAQKVASNAFWTVYRGDFPQEIALEKWWSLELVRRSSASPAQNLSAGETSRQLDAILLTKLSPTGGRKGMPDQTDVTIGDLRQYAEAPWLKDVLKLKIDRLGMLRSQAHPLYHLALDKYLEAVTWLYRGNTIRFRRGLNRAELARAAAEKQSRGITAYMDQAERIYTPEELSQAFTGYFQTLDQLQKLDTQRRSPISDYLDQFDH